MLFHLNKTYETGYGNADVKCPFCHCEIDVEWTTEYGDPLPGDHSGKCPECNKEFEFNCEINVSYSALKA